MTTLLSIDTRSLRVQRYVGRTIDSAAAQLDPDVPGETREDVLAAIEAFRVDGSVTEPPAETPPNDPALYAWQPIATAPKDEPGTLMGLVDGVPIDICWQSPCSDHPELYGWCHFKNEDDYGEPVFPTHWAERVHPEEPPNDRA